MPDPTSPSFRCPECGAVSYHPEDIRQGYCGRCHKWTGEEPTQADDDLVAEIEATDRELGWDGRWDR